MPVASEGYVYIADENAGAMANAHVGAQIRLRERSPPWIVVDHSIDSIIVARWPGKLWRVQNVDASGIEQANPQAHYTRAIAVDICEELPAWSLFGNSGRMVSAVMAVANQLDLSQVSALASARHSDASEVYSHAWNNWLAARSDNRLRSPINCGFTVLHMLISNRADSIVGLSAFVIEDGERYLEPTWSSASSALLEAAMAFGAPALLTEGERQVLLAAWRAVIGINPV